MEIKEDNLGPEVEKVDHSVESDQSVESKTHASQTKPRLILTASLVLGVCISYFVYNQNKSEIEVQPIPNENKQTLGSEFSYEQFPVSDVSKISSKEDLPLEIRKMDPILFADLKKEVSELRVVNIYDFLENDGDVVEIIINNHRLGFFNLTNSEQSISFPFYKNSMTEVRVKAVDDGGGGVTFAMKGSASELKSKVMQLGESFVWRFTK